jgi:hypothetical protein
MGVWQAASRQMLTNPAEVGKIWQKSERSSGGKPEPPWLASGFLPKPLLYKTSKTDIL